MVKKLPVNAGDIKDASSIPGSGRSPGGEHGSLPQCSCLENPPRQSSLTDCSPRGSKESDMTEATAHACTGAV